MFYKKIIIILISLLFYQSPILSKSISFNKINSKNLSNYFSGIVAFENKENTEALNYFNSSKILIDHVYDSYFRAIVLIKTLKLLNKNSSHLPIIKNNLKYNPYFIIHPVLKHLSILSKY